MKDGSRHTKNNQFSFVGRLKKKKIRDNMQIKQGMKDGDDVLPFTVWYGQV